VAAYANNYLSRFGMRPLTEVNLWYLQIRHANAGFGHCRMSATGQSLMIRSAPEVNNVRNARLFQMVE
jgi:hypothetical protein